MTLTVPVTLPLGGVVGTTRATWDADKAVTALYATEYDALVRLAALLLRDTGAAEEVVQDAFVAMHSSWRRLRDKDRALAYLRQTVVNRSRSALRRRATAERYVQTQRPRLEVASAEHEAMSSVEQDTILAALRGLPTRQREALVLRYYGDLSEAEIAEAMGISRGAVKSHASRGMAALRATLERQP